MASETFRPSAACCTTPAIVGPTYTAQGGFIEVDGTATYATGPTDAKVGVFMIYDVFGFSSQIMEGADILAKPGYRVFMPGFFGDSPAPMDWMPMDREGEVDEAKLDEFCDGPGETQKTLKRIRELLPKLKDLCPSIERWCLVGYCWGGYIVPFLCGKDTPFAVCAALHPGFPGRGVPEQMSIPYLALCSKDEPEETFQAFKRALKVPSKFIVFAKMVHGWMSARGDLSKPLVRERFEEGYALILDWFQKHL